MQLHGDQVSSSWDALVLSRSVVEIALWPNSLGEYSGKGRPCTEPMNQLTICICHWLCDPRHADWMKYLLGHAFVFCVLPSGAFKCLAFMHAKFVLSPGVGMGT